MEIEINNKKLNKLTNELINNNKKLNKLYKELNKALLFEKYKKI